jgi:hypothetical protein
LQRNGWRCSYRQRRRRFVSRHGEFRWLGFQPGFGPGHNRRWGCWQVHACLRLLLRHHFEKRLLLTTPVVGAPPQQPGDDRNAGQQQAAQECRQCAGHATFLCRRQRRFFLLMLACGAGCRLLGGQQLALRLTELRLGSGKRIFAAQQRRYPCLVGAQCSQPGRIGFHTGFRQDSRGTQRNPGPHLLDFRIAAGQRQHAFCLDNRLRPDGRRLLAHDARLYRQGACASLRSGPALGAI